MTRIVIALGWPYRYRAFVVRYDGWFRHGWRYVLERHLVHWNEESRSRIYKTELEAIDAANRRLDVIAGITETRNYVDYV